MSSVQSTTGSSIHRVKMLGIGSDGLSSVFQYLPIHDLFACSQVCRQFYETLAHRQSYYQPTTPSVHRNEFNIHQYHRWQRIRRPIRMSVEQLLLFSRSRVMSHQQDIELQLDQCQAHISTSSTVTSSNTATILSADFNQSKLREVWSALSRFPYVRCLKLYFCPTVFTPCPCVSGTPADWQANQSWHVQVAEMCLEQWGHQLLVFEWDQHTAYKCRMPKDFIIRQLPVLQSIQLVGLLSELPPTWHHEEFISSFRFPSDESGLLVLHGYINHHLEKSQFHSGDPPPPVKTFTNAAHVLWLSRSNRSENIFELFRYNHQHLSPDLHTNPSRYLSIELPVVPFTPSQLRSLRIESSYWKKGEYGHPHHFIPWHDRRVLEVMKDQLELIVQHFTPHKAKTQTPHAIQAINPKSLPLLQQPHLESLTIFDYVAFHTGWIDYRPYLALFRRTLRVLSFASNMTSLVEVEETDEYAQESIQTIPELLLPIYCDTSRPHFDTSHSPSDDQLIWPKLEVLDLRYGASELFSSFAHPPLDANTWAALGRILPALTTLGISGRLLPIHYPMNGILLQVTDLTLCLQRELQFGSLEGEWVPYTIQVSSYVRLVVTQLRQLKSLHLKVMTNSQVLVTPTAFFDCLLPLVLSSNNLRLFSIDWLPIDLASSTSLTMNDLKNLFTIYSLWQFLQPSFLLPTRLDLDKELFYPLLSNTTREHYETMSTIRQTNPIFIQPDLSTRIKNQWSDWKSRWNLWRVGGDEKAIRMKAIADRRRIFDSVNRRIRERCERMLLEAHGSSFPTSTAASVDDVVHGRSSTCLTRTFQFEIESCVSLRSAWIGEARV